MLKMDNYSSQALQFLLAPSRRDKHRLFRLACILSFSLITFASSDTNAIFSPCGDPDFIERGIGFSFAIAFGGDSVSWNNSSPCDPISLSVLPAGVQMSVFRLKVDEMTLLRINNISMASVSTSFPEMTSMIAYAGSQPAVFSKARTIRTSKGRVPAFNLVLQFRRGKLVDFLWKDETCKACGMSSDYCFDNDANCAMAEEVCVASPSSTCRLAIHVAFSGTDKHNALLNSWYQIHELNKYSLTDLYAKLAGNTQDSLGYAIDDSDTITQG